MPVGIVLLFIVWWLCRKRHLHGLAEMSLGGGFVFTHEFMHEMMRG